MVSVYQLRNRNNCSIKVYSSWVSYCAIRLTGSMQLRPHPFEQHFCDPSQFASDWHSSMQIPIPGWGQLPGLFAFCGRHLGPYRVFSQGPAQRRLAQVIFPEKKSFTKQKMVIWLKVYHWIKTKFWNFLNSWQFFRKSHKPCKTNLLKVLLSIQKVYQ